MYCPQCKANLPDDAQYCIKCGYDFSRIKTPPARKASSDPLDDIETFIGQEIDTSSFTKGSFFANRYEILDDGKKGGMGAVYKCKDTKLNKIVALKIIHPRLLSSQQALSRFRQEVAISQELQHPNIVKVHDLQEWEGKEYFTMEWVEGMTLREIITERQSQGRPFGIDEAHRIMSQLCDALHYAHQHTVHRDIKPENVLVSDEKTLKVKITDFGIAKMLSPSQFTSTSMKMGTPYYMAPEQQKDAGIVDKRADVYALGVVLFELLILSNTIGLKLPSQLNASIPKEIDDLLVKALEEKPENRYRDAKEFSDLLGQIVDEPSWKAEEAVQRNAEDEKNRKAEEEKKKIEAEETERKRQAADRQKAAAEEKANIEATKKTIAAEKDRIERENKKIEEERQQREAEEHKKQEEARRRKESEANKTRKTLAIIVVSVVLIGLIVYFKGIGKNEQQQMATEPVKVTAPAAISAPSPASAPAGAGKEDLSDELWKSFGIKIEDINEKLREQYRIPETVLNGVIVVASRSAFLKSGDVLYEIFSGNYQIRTGLIRNKKYFLDTLKEALPWEPVNSGSEGQCFAANYFSSEKNDLRALTYCYRSRRQGRQ